MSSDAENVQDCVVLHFLRLPGGELRCRVVDANSKRTWLVSPATALQKLVFASAPTELSKMKTKTNKEERDEEVF